MVYIEIALPAGELLFVVARASISFYQLQLFNCYASNALWPKIFLKEGAKILHKAVEKPFTAL